ncbi:MAG: hypothetical protein ABIR32_11045 [Ilumatobacteraceae bacterium]
MPPELVEPAVLSPVLVAVLAAVLDAVVGAVDACVLLDDFASLPQPTATNASTVASAPPLSNRPARPCLVFLMTSPFVDSNRSRHVT